MRVRARRRWRWPADAGSGSGLGLSLSSLPGLVLFESGFRVWAEQIRSTPLPNPLQPVNGCPREQIRAARQRVSASGSEPFTNRCRKTDRAVGRLNGCDGSVRTVATVGKMADENALPERYK